MKTTFSPELRNSGSSKGESTFAIMTRSHTDSMWKTLELHT